MMPGLQSFLVKLYYKFIIKNKDLGPVSICKVMESLLK